MKKLKILLTVVAFVCAAGTAVFAATYNECRCNLGNSAGFGDNNASICCPLASTTSLTTSYAALNPDKCCALQPGKTWDNNLKTCKSSCPVYGEWTEASVELPKGAGGYDVHTCGYTSAADTCDGNVATVFTCDAVHAGKTCTDYQVTEGCPLFYPPGGGISFNFPQQVDSPLQNTCPTALTNFLKTIGGQTNTEKDQQACDLLCANGACWNMDNHTVYCDANMKCDSLLVGGGSPYNCYSTHVICSQVRHPYYKAQKRTVTCC